MHKDATQGIHRHVRWDNPSTFKYKSIHALGVAPLHADLLDGFLGSVIQVICSRQLDSAAAENRFAFRNVCAYTRTHTHTHKRISMHHNSWGRIAPKLQG